MQVFLGAVSTNNLILIGGSYGRAIEIGNLPENISTIRKQFMLLIDKFSRKITFDPNEGQKHFNIDKITGRIHSRLYLTARPEFAPESLDALEKALYETKTHDKVYFKFMDPARYDQIVVYVSEDTEDAVKRVVEAYQRHMPAEKLLNMPSAVALAPGVSFGAEPDNLNKLFKSLGGQKRSYNELISTLFERSFSMAYQDAIAAGTQNPTPKQIKEPARKYFEEMVRLSGLSPETMIPKIVMQDRPEWSSWVTGQAANFRSNRAADLLCKIKRENRSMNLTQPKIIKQYFEVPCDHPEAKGKVLRAIPQLYGLKNEPHGRTYMMADVDKLIAMIEETDPKIMEHARDKYRGETASQWLKHNHEYPLETGGFKLCRRHKPSLGIVGVLKSVFGFGADPTAQTEEVLRMVIGNAGFLILIQELGLKQIPIGVETDNRNDMLSIVRKIGYGHNPIIREQNQYPNFRLGDLSPQVI